MEPNVESNMVFGALALFHGYGYRFPNFEQHSPTLKSRESFARVMQRRAEKTFDKKGANHVLSRESRAMLSPSNFHQHAAYSFESVPWTSRFPPSTAISSPLL